MNYDFSVIGIGSSAGGLAPLTEIISGLPAHINAAIVIVPHLSAQFESHLAHILSKTAHMEVIKVRQKTLLEPGKVYVMPEGKMMLLEDGYLTLRDRMASEKINKAINIFFASLANDAQEKSIGIILSGAGHDGVEGAKAIESYQGIVMVQDPDSAQFPLMPNTLINNDHPDYILMPKDIVDKIIDRVKELDN